VRVLRRHPNPKDGWTEVACLESESGPFKAELARTLNAFLAERGMSRNEIADHDIRVVLVYLGPAKGRCARRLLVRTAALRDDRAEAPC
jgi:hypothetical protein